MAGDDELTSAHERLRLATAAYAEMISDDLRLQTDTEADEVLRRQLRAQVAWEHYLRLRDA